MTTFCLFQSSVFEKFQSKSSFGIELPVTFSQSKGTLRKVNRRAAWRQAGRRAWVGGDGPRSASRRGL